MNKILKLSVKSKIFLTTILFLYAFLCLFTGVNLFVKADTPEDIVAPTTGFNAVAQYEFKDEDNFGKDSLNNFDLVAVGVTIDYDNGGVSLGQTGHLYAPDLGNGADFSDLIKGSYSISTRMRLRSVNDASNYLISTGSYGSDFQLAWANKGLSVTSNSSQKAQFGTTDVNAIGDINLFDETFSWYRITMIYDDVNLTFRMLVTKEGDTTYLFDETATFTDHGVFGGHADRTFTIGAQAKMNGTSVAQNASALIGTDEYAYLSISDLRIYSGIIDNDEINAIKSYDEENLKNNDPSNLDKKDVKPIVWYEFNDKDNLGKDSMGNFDLTVGGDKKIGYSDDGYVTFKKEDKSFLYAPYLYGAVDWSDLLKGGYTVSLTLNADNEVKEGNRYAVSTSTYGNAFCIAGSYSGYNVYHSGITSTKKYSTFATGSHKDKWTNVTVTMDKSTSELAIYVNGSLFSEVKLDEDTYKGFSVEDAYTFTVGAQAKGDGSAHSQYFEGSIDDVKVYDFPLSAKNVSDLYVNKETNTPLTSIITYDTVVESVNVDTINIDLVISRDNTVENVLGKLPKTVTVVDSKENQETCAVEWLGYENGIIKGYVKNTTAFNVESKFAIVKLSYKVDFLTLSNGTYSDVKINDLPYNGELLDFGIENVLTFKVVANNGYYVSSVAFNNEKINPDTQGVYTLTLDGDGLVSVTIAPEEYVITYVLNNGNENEEQIYAYGENVSLADYFTKEGYFFGGWYDNAELTGEKVTSIDSLNPKDITLYAKWTQDVPETDKPANKSGCGSSIQITTALLPLCFVAVATLRRKKGD